MDRLRPLRLSAIGTAALIALAAAPQPARGQAAAVAGEGSAASLPLPPAPSAEQWFRRGAWVVGVHVGGAAFTDLHRATARPATAGLNAHRIQRRVSAGTTGSAALSGTYWVTGGWGLRGSVGYTPSSFSVWTDEDRAVLTPGADGSDRRYAGLDIVSADLALVFRFPGSLGRVVPYGLAGGGLTRFTARGGGELPPEASEGFGAGPRQAPTALLGLGAAVPLQRRSLLLTFELTAHVTPTPLDQAGSDRSFELAGVPLRLEQPTGRGAADGVGHTTAVRLLVGVALPLR